MSGLCLRLAGRGHELPQQGMGPPAIAAAAAIVCLPLLLPHPPAQPPNPTPTNPAYPCSGPPLGGGTLSLLGVAAVCMGAQVAAAW